MKIYRTAQTSSIMYFVETLPIGIMLSPDPEIANHDRDEVPAFALSPGKYYSPDSYKMDLTPELVEELRQRGYLGVIQGEYMFVFGDDALRPIGNYDFIQHVIVR